MRLLIIVLLGILASLSSEEIYGPSPLPKEKVAWPSNVLENIKDFYWPSYPVGDLHVQLTPNHLQIGMVEVKVVPFPQGLKFDSTISPQIHFHNQDHQSPFQITEFSPTLCRAQLLITEEHPEGRGTVKISNFYSQQGAPFVVKSAPLQIDQVGGEWPLPSKWKQAVAEKNSPKLWLQGEVDEPVRAIEDGSIVSVDSEENGSVSLGIKRLRGSLTWNYANLRFADKHWKAGAFVKQGDILGKLAPLAKQELSYLQLSLWQSPKQQQALTIVPSYLENFQLLAEEDVVLDQLLNNNPSQTAHTAAPKPAREIPSSERPWSLTHTLWVIYGLAFLYFVKIICQN